MKTGLLWYDGDNQRTLLEKVQRAAQRYRQKLGRTPTMCYVHPSSLSGLAGPGLALDCRLDGCPARIWVIAATCVLPHHFWMGEGDAPSAVVVSAAPEGPQQEQARPGEQPPRQVRPPARRHRGAGQSASLVARSGQ